MLQCNTFPKCTSVVFRLIINNAIFYIIRIISNQVNGFVLHSNVISKTIARSNSHAWVVGALGKYAIRHQLSNFNTSSHVIYPLILISFEISYQIVNWRHTQTLAPSVIWMVTMCVDGRVCSVHFLGNTQTDSQMVLWSWRPELLQQ